MLPLLIESTESYAGKSLVCLGLGLKFQKDGFKIAYLKPLGKSPIRIDKVTTDEDAVFIQDALRLDEPLDQLCPVVVTQDLIIDAYDGKVKGLEKKVKDAYGKVSRGKDIVLIGGGGSLHEGTLFGLSSVNLARNFKAKVILIDNAEHETNVDCILKAKEGLQDTLIGVILNRVPPYRIDFIKKKVIPFFK
ncbi:MAG: AAA family ATPase, partial [Deltaproteobacteria bacterium]|nr:AAA family ATPase [Deltaproteobacteria bacterium]